MVYFKLKDSSGANRAKLAAACKLFLTGHEGTVSFAVGTLAGDLNGPFNDHDFDVSLHLVFVNKAALDKYHEHSRHEKFLEENKEKWEKVRVFDSYLSPALPAVTHRSPGSKICRHTGGEQGTRSLGSEPYFGSGRLFAGCRIEPGVDGERERGMEAGPAGWWAGSWPGRQDDLDRSIELWVLAHRHGGGVLLDLDVGSNADVLDHPAFLGEDRQIGSRHESAVHQDREAKNADQAAPGSLADQFAQAKLTEYPRQEVASRTG